MNRDIPIHCLRIGLLFSLASAIAAAKARQPNNTSTGARQHTGVLETLHLLTGAGVEAQFLEYI